MNQNDINRLVDEELARRRIGVAFDPPESRLTKGLRHPLFLTVFAFVVTTVLGGWYDHVLKEREEDRVEAQRAHERALTEARNAVDGLKSFATLVYERQTRSHLVKTAVLRGDASEARERKRAYDALYIKWNTELLPNLRALRGYLGDDRERSVYELAVETSIAPAFFRSDKCVTYAYDVARRLKFPFPSPDGQIAKSAACPSSDWQAALEADHSLVRTCMHTILSNMIPQIRLRALAPAGQMPNDPVGPAKIYQELRDSCPGMPERPTSD